MGDKIADKISPEIYQQFKNEVLQSNKPLGLLYDIVLSDHQDYAKIIINNFLSNDNSANNQKLKSFLFVLIKNKSITPGRFCKEVLKTYPELICKNLPKTLVTQIQAAIKPTPANCESIFKNVTDTNSIFYEMAFNDSTIVIRGKSIAYDFRKITTPFINDILDRISVDAQLKPAIQDFITHAVPSIKGKIELAAPLNNQLQASLFSNIINSNEIDTASSGKIKDQLTQVSLGLYGFGKLQSNSDFKSLVNSHTQLDTISKYENEHIDEQDSRQGIENNQDFLKNFLVQGAVNYFAPGAMQAATIVSNLFKQGQIAELVRDKNKELQEEVRNYVDKSLEKDKYLLNQYQAQHEVDINTLLAEGKRIKKNALGNAADKIEFNKQLIKDQINEYSSYYYFLLERLREKFTQYLWAYRTWYGTSYQKDLLTSDPNNLRLILDPQIRYLTFFNYSDLGKRKGSYVLREWDKVVQPIIHNPDQFKIIEQKETNLLRIFAQLEDLLKPSAWDKFKQWLTSKTDDTPFNLNLSVDLLDESSTDAWKLGNDLQEQIKDSGNNNQLLSGFRLLGINVFFKDKDGAKIPAETMFKVRYLKYDGNYPSKVNYGYNFIQESYPNEDQKKIDLGSIGALTQNVGGEKIEYFKSLWGIPLQSNYIIKLQKYLTVPTAVKAREKIVAVTVEGFYFRNLVQTISRTFSDTGPYSFKVGNTNYKISFPITDAVKSNADRDKIESIVKELQYQINKP